MLLPSGTIGNTTDNPRGTPPTPKIAEITKTKLKRIKVFTTTSKSNLITYLTDTWGIDINFYVILYEMYGNAAYTECHYFLSWSREHN